MEMRLRALVERHRDRTFTVSLLGLPPEGSEDGPGLPERWLEELLDGWRASSEAPYAPPPFSRLCGFGEDLAAVRARVADEVASRMAGAAPPALAAYRFDPDQALERVDVRLTPIDGTGAELDPIELGFDVVLTRLPRPPHGVLVPRLGLLLAIDDVEKAAEAARAEISAFLKRRPALRRLEQLWTLAPAQETSLVELPFETIVQTPLDQVRSSRGRDDRERAAARADAEVLESVGVSLGKEAALGRLAGGHELDALAEEVLRFIRGDTERAIVLVGPSGVGKTAAVHEAVRRMSGSPADERRAVWHLTGTRIVAGMSGYGEWQERCRAIVSAVKRARAVLSVGDPHELVEEGRAVGLDVSIADYLKRPIEKGEVRVIGECTEQAWDALLRRDRGFASLFRVVRVEEPDRERTLRVLRATADALERRRRGAFDRGALQTAYDLHARFAPYAAFPGKAVRFLRRLARPVEERGKAARARAERAMQRFDRRGVTHAFAVATGLPEAVLDDTVALDPDAVRDFFGRRVIAQPRATDLVVDLIARVKAGVADPRRPLGSFVFLGPTGVGKTETAKVLAEYLFGSRDRLVRLDMTEYQDRWAAARLTGGAGFENEGDLTRRVRAEPMSVVLLDEIEKADAGVFDLLLQVLGDARLTDARGRVTDFRSAIVILTSNLGADLPEGAAGFSGAAGGADDGGARFLRAAEEFFRPELINRLDAIVPFAPLPRAAIERIARRELTAALARDGLVRRGTAVQVADPLLARVVAAGFHPRFGARPLKRAIERHVVGPLARHLAERSTQGGSPRRVEIGLGEAGAARITVLEGPPAARTTRARASEASDGVPARLRVQDLLRRISGLRRRIATLMQADDVVDVRDELGTLAGMELRVAMGKPADWDPRTDAPRLARLRRVVGALETAREAACDLEDLGVVSFLDGDAAAVAAMADDVVALDRRIAEATFGLRAARFEPADAAAVLIAPLERGGPLARALVDVYEAFARERGFRAATYHEGRDARRPGGPWPAWRRRGTPRAGEATTGAHLLLVRGTNAVPYLWAEDGRHRHTPAEKGLGDRFALVRVVGLAKADAEKLAAEDEHVVPPPPPPLRPDEPPREPEPPSPPALLHTICAPGEREPRGLPSELPAVVRIYDDRGIASIRDPRTDLAIGCEGLADAARFVDRFAVALLTGGGGA